MVVVGTGTMAAGVAAAAAAVPGSSVVLCGRRLEAAEAAAEQARGLGAPQVRAAELSAETLAGADVVIETVLESVPVKHEVLAQISAWCRPDALIATNTSSLSLTELAEAVEGPARFVGLHFLYPAHETSVVEVAPGEQTASDALDRGAALTVAMGKQPLVLRKEIQGYIWNRLQFALLRECLHLLEEGVAEPDAIDTAISEGLAPRWLASGPLATADLGGLRTFALASEALFPDLSSATEVSEQLAGRMRDGSTFHEWTPDRRAAVQELRTRTLQIGREVAERRRAATD